MKRFIFYWNEGYQQGPLISFETWKEFFAKAEDHGWEPANILKISELEMGETQQFWGIMEAVFVTRVDDVEDDDTRSFTVEVTEK